MPLPTLYAATGNDVESSDYYGPGNYFEIWGPRSASRPRTLLTTTTLLRTCGKRASVSLSSSSM
ncbi:hypothetical protein GQ600_22816 [Phytophthora cactorum]|nr:hypothetical protein GQ600_22816 [Phytophthora cactorum]